MRHFFTARIGRHPTSLAVVGQVAEPTADMIRAAFLGLPAAAPAKPAVAPASAGSGKPAPGTPAPNPDGGAPAPAAAPDGGPLGETETETDTDHYYASMDGAQDQPADTAEA
jgi:hypothetical protein